MGRIVIVPLEKLCADTIILELFAQQSPVRRLAERMPLSLVIFPSDFPLFPYLLSSTTSSTLAFRYGIHTNEIYPAHGRDSVESLPIKKPRPETGQSVDEIPF